MATHSQTRLGLLFVLVGPPGAGKNTLMNRVLEQVEDLRQLPTATTRSIRPNEQHGREHLFVTQAEFQQLYEAEKLLERQEIHGQLYGIPRATVDDAIADNQDLIADIDVFGAARLKAIYPMNAVLIFVQPPSLDDLIRRMQMRGDSEAEIAKRMQRATMEMEYAPSCDYLIVNDDDLEQASEILYGIILAERSRRLILSLRAEHELKVTPHEPA